MSMKVRRHRIFNFTIDTDWMQMKMRNVHLKNCCSVWSLSFRLTLLEIKHYCLPHKSMIYVMQVVLCLYMAVFVIAIKNSEWLVRGIQNLQSNSIISFRGLRGRVDRVISILFSGPHISTSWVQILLETNFFKSDFISVLFLRKLLVAYESPMVVIV